MRKDFRRALTRSERGLVKNGGGAVNFIDAIKICFTKYADFNGCASRPEFWWWFLFTVVASLALQAVSYNLSGAFSIATFLPSVAVGARRLHDIDRNGWWQLLYFSAGYWLDCAHYLLGGGEQAESIWGLGVSACRPHR